MNIMLGNLSVNQIEQRLGIDFPKEIKEFMEQTHQASANNVAEGKWHCFDIPFHLVCGDMETAVKIYDSIKEKTKYCKESLAISITNK